MKCGKRLTLSGEYLSPKHTRFYPRYRNCISILLIIIVKICVVTIQKQTSTTCRTMAINSSPLRGFIGEQLARQPAGLNTKPVRSANKPSYWGNSHLALQSRLNSIAMDAASASMTPYSLLDGGIPRLKSVARKEVFIPMGLTALCP